MDNYQNMGYFWGYIKPFLWGYGAIGNSSYQAYVFSIGRFVYIGLRMLLLYTAENCNKYFMAEAIMTGSSLSNPIPVLQL